MIRPSLIVGDIVARLRKLDALVALLDGNPENILAFHYRWPSEASLAKVIANQPTGTLLVAHKGTSMSGVSPWTHSIAFHFRAAAQVQDEPALAYDALMQTMLDGIPTGESVPFVYGNFYGSSAFQDFAFDFTTDDDGVDYPIGVLNIMEPGIGG